MTTGLTPRRADMQTTITHTPGATRRIPGKTRTAVVTALSPEQQAFADAYAETAERNRREAGKAVMREVQKRNHPKAGERIIIEPIRSVAEVAMVKAVLMGNKRDQMLFTLGINVALRASDLLRLTWRMLYLEDEDNAMVRLIDVKTGKPNDMPVSKTAAVQLKAYRQSGVCGSGPDDLLFPSQSTKNRGEQMCTSHLNSMVKEWCRKAGIKGNHGSHTLRKTWAFLQYRVAKVDIADISEWLQHSSIAITFKYIGLPNESKRKIVEDNTW